MKKCNKNLKYDIKYINLDFLAVFIKMKFTAGSEQMAKINKITLNTPYRNDLNLYTKRTCSDNSEMYIKSKLNMLYKQALSSKIQFTSKRNLRKMVEGNHLDETV